MNITCKHNIMERGNACVICFNDAKDRIADLERQLAAMQDRLAIEHDPETGIPADEIDRLQMQVSLLHQQLAELRAKNERLREVLQDALTAMRHAEIFIRSREKMHPDGQHLYGEDLNKIEAALVATEVDDE